MSRKNPLTVFCLVDGANPDIMRELIEAGDLPNIRNEIISSGTFRTASSCLPTTTGPAFLPFLTGCFPGTLNIPGIRWLDKGEFLKKRLSKNAMRSYMGIEALFFNSDLATDYPTLFEIFQRPFNIFSIVTRGIPRGHNPAGMSKAFRYLYAHLTDRWDTVDAATHYHLLRCLDDNPDFVFALFPAVDSFSHVRHPRHEETIAAYRFIDFSVGEVVKKLKRQGRWDETLFIITSDHGLSATHQHLDLALFLQNRGLKTLYYPIIWKSNPRASVMISGNSFGHIYLFDGNCPEPIVGEQVKEMLGSIWDELLAQEEVDFVAWRGNKNTYNIESSRGRSVITRKPEGLCYHPQNGDPLGLGAMETPMDHQQALEATFNSNYPDALVQVEQLFRSHRSGDLVVLAKNGYDLRRAFEWPRHHGSHGSLHYKHMLVPLLYNKSDWNTRSVRTADLFNTILKWSGKPILKNTDGQSLY